MTTIAAVRDGARTLIGSDTLGTIGQMKFETGPKWVRHESWAVGIAGNARLADICRQRAPTLFKNLEGPFDFTERFWAVLKEFDYDLSPTEGRANPNTGHDLLLASPRGLWSIIADLSINPVERWAEGSGREFSHGALHAMRAIDDAERVLRGALEAGIAYDAGSGGEIWTDVLEG